MQQRRMIGIATIIFIGLIIGYFIKNVKTGLVIGLVIGLLAGGLLSNGGQRK
jgi:uncharacterized membrane protein (UPF0136 family)